MNRISLCLFIAIKFLYFVLCYLGWGRVWTWVYDSPMTFTILSGTWVGNTGCPAKSSTKSGHPILRRFVTMVDSLQDHCLLSEVYLICTTFRELALLSSSGDWLSLYWHGILTVVTNNTKKSVSTMINNHLKTGVEPTPETSCISDILKTMGKVQHSVPIVEGTAGNVHS
jgi:hypothetical protein